MADRELTACNTLKEQLEKEQSARKNWKRKWGIYSKEKEIIAKELDRMKLTEESYQRIVSFKKPQHKYDEAGWNLKQSGPIPITSSGMIGWRSTLDYSLEQVGPLFISPLHTVPKEPKQNYIILG